MVDSISHQFINLADNAPACEGKPRNRSNKYPRPFSIRLSDAERAWLVKQAGGKSLSAYIKAQLFNGQNIPSQGKRTSPVRDDQALARTLAALGSSRLSSNLNQIAKSAHVGALPVTPELIQELNYACEEIKAMRDDLVTALGLKPKGRR